VLLFAQATDFFHADRRSVRLQMANGGNDSRCFLHSNAAVKKRIKARGRPAKARRT